MVSGGSKGPVGAGWAQVRVRASPRVHGSRRERRDPSASRLHWSRADPCADVRALWSKGLGLYSALHRVAGLQPEPADAPVLPQLPKGWPVPWLWQLSQVPMGRDGELQHLCRVHSPSVTRELLRRSQGSGCLPCPAPASCQPIWGGRAKSPACKQACLGDEGMGSGVRARPSLDEALSHSPAIPVTGSVLSWAVGLDPVCRGRNAGRLRDTLRGPGWAAASPS